MLKKQMDQNTHFSHSKILGRSVDIQNDPHAKEKRKIDGHDYPNNKRKRIFNLNKEGRWVELI